jgi:replicative DNA helicase
LKEEIVKTGFNVIDNNLELKTGELIMLGARPAVGKTTLALNMALKHSKRNNGAVLVFSYEMLASEITSKMLSIVSDVEYKKVIMKNYDNLELEKIGSGVNDLARCPIYINDETYNLNQIIEQVERVNKETKVSLVIIDYIQLLESGKKDSALKALKKIAKANNCLVIALSQLKKESVLNEIPSINDFRVEKSNLDHLDQCIILKNIDQINDEKSIFMYSNNQEPPIRKHIRWESKYLRFSDTIEER